MSPVEMLWTVNVFDAEPGRVTVVMAVVVVMMTSMKIMMMMMMTMVTMVMTHIHRGEGGNPPMITRLYDGEDEVDHMSTFRSIMVVSQVMLTMSMTRYSGRCCGCEVLW